MDLRFRFIPRIDQIRSAIQRGQSRFVPENDKISLRIVPFCVQNTKDGGRFDLPIALGILAANGGIPREHPADCEFIGELALSGELRPVHGVLPAVLHATRIGRRVIVPRGNGAEAALVASADVRVADSLLEVCAYLAGRVDLARAQMDTKPAIAHAEMPDLADVRGQLQARRALEIAAAGSHNLLRVGLNKS